MYEKEVRKNKMKEEKEKEKEWKKEDWKETNKNKLITYGHLNIMKVSEMVKSFAIKQQRILFVKFSFLCFGYCGDALITYVQPASHCESSYPYYYR